MSPLLLRVFRGRMLISNNICLVWSYRHALWSGGSLKGASSRPTDSFSPFGHPMWGCCRIILSIGRSSCSLRLRGGVLGVLPGQPSGWWWGRGRKFEMSPRWGASIRQGAHSAPFFYCWLPGATDIRKQKTDADNRIIEKTLPPLLRSVFCFQFSSMI